MIHTFREGVILPEFETDCKGTVRPRPEIRTPVEEPLRNDDLGDAESGQLPSHGVQYDPAVYRDANNQP